MNLNLQIKLTNVHFAAVKIFEGAVQSLKPNTLVVSLRGWGNEWSKLLLIPLLCAFALNQGANFCPGSVAAKSFPHGALLQVVPTPFYEEDPSITLNIPQKKRAAFLEYTPVDFEGSLSLFWFIQEYLPLNQE